MNKLQLDLDMVVICAFVDMNFIKITVKATFCLLNYIETQ